MIFLRTPVLLIPVEALQVHREEILGILLSRLLSDKATLVVLCRVNTRHDDVVQHDLSRKLLI